MRVGAAETQLGTVAAAPPPCPERTMGSGWQAALALGFERRGARTVLATRRHHGPLTVQRPFYPEGNGICHTYVLHPPAGIVGGDTLALDVRVESGAHALVTTPSATRWYWSRAVEARVAQHATVAAGATLEWLPQETLLFAGAHARLATRIDLAGDARFCGWEILGLGRPACGEPFSDGRIDFRFELHRDGLPLVLERLRGGADGLPGMHGHAACATLLATGADQAALAAAREALEAARTFDPAQPGRGAPSDTLAAATLIGDVLIARGIAARCEPLIATFTRLWSALRPLVLGHVAVPPRIWHT